MTAAGSGERGAALPAVLVLAIVLVGVTGWVVGHVHTERADLVLLEDAAEAERVAAAASQSVAMALGVAPTWSDVAALVVALPCPPTAGLTAPIDEGREEVWLQAATDAVSRWGGDTPRWRPVWRCHGAGLLDREAWRGRAPVVAVWMADDPDGDGDPWRDANGRLRLTAVARAGSTGARGAVSATIARSGPGQVVVLAAWRPDSGG